jgi:hypothetical protein
MAPIRDYPAPPKDTALDKVRYADVRAALLGRRYTASTIGEP